MPLIKRQEAPPDAAPAHGHSYEMLLAELQSPDDGIRRNAARYLGDRAEAADALCGALPAETHASVRGAIFTALIRIASPAAAAGLVPLLDSEDVALRNGAIEALKSMPDAVSPFIAQIMAGNADVRGFGIDIVRCLERTERRRWLVAVLDGEPDVNVCAGAVDALVDCGDAESIAPLRRLRERFPDEPLLDFSIRTALDQIESSM